MMNDEKRDICSISRCPSPSVQTESGTVGHWAVTIFYCDEHARQLEAGTPLGPIGVDQERVRIESMGVTEMPHTGNRFPGLA